IKPIEKIQQSKPLFEPYKRSLESQKQIRIQSYKILLLKMNQQLDNLDTSTPTSHKSGLVIPDTPQQSIGQTSKALDVIEESSSTSVAGSSDNENSPEIAKLKWEPIYQKHTTPDLGIEQKPNVLTQHKYSSQTIYEWNIDGMSEYNILGLLHQMTMAANAYRTQTNTPDKAIAKILIAGFSGQLKGWWDYYITRAQKLEILNSVKMNEENEPILDQNQQPIENGVATLIVTISAHFIGDPTHIKDKNSELLSNLKCKK